MSRLQDAEEFVPHGAHRLWPFAVRDDPAAGSPGWRRGLFVVQGVARALVRRPIVKPGAIGFWQGMPEDWLVRFVRDNGAGSEHPSRTFVASCIARGESVLDVGCGTGVDYEVLVEAGKAADYVGVDVTEKSIRIARELFPGADFRTGDVTRLEEMLGPHSFDVVLMRSVLEHQPDFELPMSQAIAVARRIAIFVFYLPPRRLPFGVRAEDPRRDAPYYVNIYSRLAINRYLAHANLHWIWHDHIGESRSGWLAGESNSVLLVSRLPS